MEKLIAVGRLIEMNAKRRKKLYRKWRTLYHHALRTLAGHSTIKARHLTEEEERTAKAEFEKPSSE
jgi:hypothetical protein